MTSRYSENFESFFNITRFFSAMCGADIFNKNYRMSWVTWCIIVLINGAIIFNIYSMYVGVAKHNDLTQILKCLSMFGAGVQGYAKLINAIKHQESFRFIHNEIMGIYVDYERKTKIFHCVLKGSITLNKKVIIFAIIFVFMSFLAIVFVPILYNLIFDERAFIMPFFFPYIDYESDFGYYLTSAFHVLCIFFGAFGNFVSDSWCFLFVAHIPLVKNILQIKFNILDEILTGEKKNAKDVNVIIKDIFQWHQKYIVFCNTIKDIFFWVIFVQVSSEFISIVCTVVCLFLGVWPAAPAFLVYSFLLFVGHCFLGNLMELSNEDITSMITNSCWYMLSISQQKMILIMLRESQKAKGMSIGGVVPLSMNTALQMTKTIYTISMMLNNFLN
ncbi:odorant receptor 67d-like [Cochliomyia hominivorax]